MRSGPCIPQTTVLDFSDEACDARTAMMAERADALAHADFGDLSGENAITHRILHYVLEDGFYGEFRGRSGHRFIDNPYPVNHLTGHHPLALLMLTRDHVVRETADAEAYIARLAAFAISVSGVRDALRARLAKGIVAPRFTLERSVADMTAFIAPAADANILVTSFEMKLRSVGLSDAVHLRLLAQATRLVAREIVPAYQQLIAATQEAVDKAGEERGVWALPDGDAYYAWLLRGHTTTDSRPTPPTKSDSLKPPASRMRSSPDLRNLVFGETASGISTPRSATGRASGIRTTIAAARNCGLMPRA